MKTLQPNILVTGGTGLVGAHLLAHLCLAGKQVRALYRNETALEEVKQVFSYYEVLHQFSHLIEWKKADITDLPALDTCFIGIEYVFHCAAMVSFNDNDFDSMYKTNIEGTANMVNVSLQYGVKKFCHVSSIATLSTEENNPMINETNSWNPEKETNPYAITKYGAEMEVWRANQEGLPVIVINPGVILGSGFWNSHSGQIFTKIKKGFPFYTEGVTGFVGVQDVVNTMLQLMASTIENEKFIVVSENVSYKQILHRIAEAFQVKKPTVRLTKFWGEVIGSIVNIVALLTRTKPFISLHTLRSAQNKSYYESDKIKNALPIVYQKIDDVIKGIVSDYQRDNL